MALRCSVVLCDGMPDATAVPWWGRLSSVLAPVLLVGGWTLAASLQPEGFDSSQDTISALAALDASYRWVMTLAIAGTGACHLVTALGLRVAARPGRILLGLGGLATLLVALFPLPASNGSSVAHGVAAFVAFLTLSVWPCGAWRRGPEVPWGLRPIVSLAAGAVLVALLVAFGVALGRESDVGLAERVAAGAQALWPAVVVATVPVVRRARQGMLAP
jgi:hypothetical membrane protein